MDDLKFTRPSSPLRIPPAIPTRKQRLWSQGQSAAQSMVERSNKDKYQNSMGQSEVGEDGLASSAWVNAPSESLSPAVSTTLNYSTEVPEAFWEPDYPSQRFRPVESEEQDPYYSPPPQFFSPPVSPNEDCVERTNASGGPLTSPKVSLTYRSLVSDFGS